MSIDFNIKNQIKEYGMRIINSTSFDSTTMVNVTPSLINKGISIEANKIVVIPYRGDNRRNYLSFDMFNDSSSISHFKLDDNFPIETLVLNEASKAINGGLGLNGSVEKVGTINSSVGAFYQNALFDGTLGGIINFGNTTVSNRLFMGEPQDLVMSCWLNISSIKDSTSAVGNIIRYMCVNYGIGNLNNSGIDIELTPHAIDPLNYYTIKANRISINSETYIDFLGNTTTSNKISCSTGNLNISLNKDVHLCVFMSLGNIKIYIDGALINYLTTYINNNIIYNLAEDKFTTIAGKLDNGVYSNQIKGSIDNFRFFSKANFSDGDALVLFNEGI